MIKKGLWRQKATLRHLVETLRGLWVDESPGDAVGFAILVLGVEAGRYVIWILVLIATLLGIEVLEWLRGLTAG